MVEDSAHCLLLLTARCAPAFTPGGPRESPHNIEWLCVTPPATAAALESPLPASEHPPTRTKSSAARSVKRLPQADQEHRAGGKGAQNSRRRPPPPPPALGAPTAASEPARVRSKRVADKGVAAARGVCSSASGPPGPHACDAESMPRAFALGASTVPVGIGPQCGGCVWHSAWCLQVIVQGCVSACQAPWRAAMPSPSEFSSLLLLQPSGRGQALPTHCKARNAWVQAMRGMSAGTLCSEEKMILALRRNPSRGASGPNSTFAVLRPNWVMTKRPNALMAVGGAVCIAALRHRSSRQVILK